MPLVAHNALPTFERLRRNGQTVLTRERAEHQDIRELHIGLLNMMPDAALAATEEQFMRLVGSSNQIAQFFVHPFSLPELNRSEAAEAHIAEFYSSFDEIADHGLDALIISGANVANPSLDREPFWQPLTDVVHWAEQNVASILCSCLATHALVKQLHGIDRRPLPSKQWGVYAHRIGEPQHPLLRDINTRFDAPHSRYNAVMHDDLESEGVRVIVDSEEAGVHLAVSPDRFRVVYFQGHPEYGANSLLKEYKREVNRFLAGEIDAPPPYPENYFSTEAKNIAAAYVEKATAARDAGESIPAFPESALETLVHNTWGDTGKAIVSNWLGLVYQLTNLDRHRQFMPGVDPKNPLGIRSD